MLVRRARVQPHRKSVASALPLYRQSPCSGAKLGAAIGNVRAAAQVQYPPFARHGRFGDELVDPQRAHVDIEIGQQRRIGFGRHLQGGNTVQDHARGAGAANVDMAAQVGKGPPVDRHARRGQKGPLAVLQRQIVQGHSAIDRTLDPPDRDAHSIGKVQRGNLPDDQAMAGSGVDADCQSGYQQGQPQHTGKGDAQAPPEARRRG